MMMRDFQWETSMGPAFSVLDVSKVPMVWPATLNEGYPFHILALHRSWKDS
jgi:hypothetical protein